MSEAVQCVCEGADWALFAPALMLVGVAFAVAWAYRKG